MEKRVISTQIQEEDLKIEKSLRPQTLSEYIGHGCSRHGSTA